MKNAAHLAMAVLLALALSAFIPGACLADTRGLFVLEWEDGVFQLALDGEFDLTLGGGWGFALAGGIAYPLTGDGEACLDLELTWVGDDWRWQATAGFAHTVSDDEGEIGLRGSYARSPWSMAGTVYRAWEFVGPDGELGFKGYVTWQPARAWRLSLAQEIADVTVYTGGLRYQRYHTEAALSWRGDPYWCKLTFDGSAHRGEEPIDDERVLGGKFAWGREFAGRWSLTGELSLEQTEGPDPCAEYAASMALTREGPIGLKFRVDYEGGENDEQIRAGCDIRRDGDLSWRAGLAGAADLAVGSWETSFYAVFGWKSGPWRVEIGLAPRGEYAATSSRGYWVTFSYRF